VRRYEQVHVLEKDNVADLEQEYNSWFKNQVEFHESVPALKATPFKVIDRVLSIRNYNGAETYVLAVFYEYFELEAHESGPDKGAGKHLGGVSAFGRQR
jgi:hypothetical protein